MDYRILFYFIAVLLGTFIGIYLGLCHTFHKKKKIKRKKRARINQKRRNVFRIKRRKRKAQKLLTSRIDDISYSNELFDEEENVKTYFIKKRGSQDEKYQHLLEK